MNTDQRAEWLTCAESAPYFLHHHCQIYDATARTWIPFALWPAQIETLKTIHAHQLTIILKARQLGITWLGLGYALWQMLFNPAATQLLFSKRDDEAVYLLGVERMRGMYERLPAWMRARAVLSDNDHEFALSNGSVARAFPTTAGDSYTASLAMVDEADLVPDLGRLMNAVKPTIDTGGKMILLSRPDKSKPESEFKRIYRAAREGKNAWAAVFLPWHVRPGRDAHWYAQQKADVLARTGSEDDLHQQYPATETEALSPRTLDKRIAPNWLERCYVPLSGLDGEETPAIPGLTVYRLPEAKRSYVMGADPAEGNPNSDDSALTVVDARSGEEVAALAGKLEPSTFAGHIHAIGKYYNYANVMVERNNHGHAVLLHLRDHSPLHRLSGEDGKDGWLSNSKGKSLMYARVADAFRDGETVLHSFATYHQLASVEGGSLRAPQGQHDDRADSYALALMGMSKALSGRLVY